jgi:hypothetical protein
MERRYRIKTKYREDREYMVRVECQHGISRACDECEGDAEQACIEAAPNAELLSRNEDDHFANLVTEQTKEDAE